MKITKHIHALEIPFKIPVAPDKLIGRVVYVYLIFGENITLIDSGVSGADSIIFNYIKKNGREPKEVSRLILSHSHPDHIGAAKAIQQATGCIIAAHSNEKHWIEDTEEQFKDRPVPGFHSLVGGSVAVDRLLEGGETFQLDKELQCKVIHSPGHSSGSISLLFEDEQALFTADTLPLPGDLPIYENITDCVNSIMKLKNMSGVVTLLSSWEPPIHGKENIHERMDGSLAYLRRIHEAVLEARDNGTQDPMELCKRVVSHLGLPPFAANPLTAKAFASSLYLS